MKRDDDRMPSGDVVVDDCDPELVRQLQVMLLQEASLPIGLRARVEAKVISALRAPGTGRPFLLPACALFIILGARPEVVAVGPLAIVTFLAVAAYIRLLSSGEELERDVTLH